MIFFKNCDFCVHFEQKIVYFDPKIHGGNFAFFIMSWCFHLPRGVPYVCTICTICTINLLITNIFYTVHDGLKWTKGGFFQRNHPIFIFWPVLMQKSTQQWKRITLYLLVFQFLSYFAQKLDFKGKNWWFLAQNLLYLGLWGGHRWGQSWSNLTPNDLFWAKNNQFFP